MKRKEDIQSESNLKHNFEYEILGEYITSKTKIEIKHKICGNVFMQSPNHHISHGNGCPKCSGNKKLTKDEIQNRSNKIHNNEYVIVSEYTNSSIHVDILHKKCNSIFKQLPLHHLSGHGCSKCKNVERYTKEILQDKSNTIHNSEYTIIGNYVNNKTKIEILHSKCNNIYLQRPDDHLKGHGCSFCYENKMRTTDEFISETTKKFNNEFEILSEYNGANKKIKIKHKICGNTYMQVANSHIIGIGCPVCKESHNERVIRNFLSENNINFESQFKFKDCKSINLLPFDFYLPEIKTCIEYDGRQHYEIVEWFGGKETFDKLKIRDKIKDDYCVNNNIRLIRISYLDDTLEILQKTIF